MRTFIGWLVIVDFSPFMLRNRNMLSTDYNEILIGTEGEKFVKKSPSLPQKRIVVVATGSRGELQPYIALALHLKQRGHDVAIATEARVRALVEEFGLEYVNVYGDSTGALFEPSAQKVLKDGSIFQLIKLTEEWDKKFPKDKIYASMVTACVGADLIIGANLTLTPTYCVAEYMGVPWVPMILGPTMPTSEFPIWPLASIAVCSCLNKWTYNFLFRTLWSTEAKTINPWRKSLGLPEVKNSRGLMDLVEERAPPLIIACSPLLCGPKQTVPADYPHFVHLNGFVFVPPSSDEAITPELLDFVDRDPQATSAADKRPLVYMGFGSMPAPNPLDLVKIAVDTCATARCRAVLVAGWSDLNSNAACVDLLAEALQSGTIMVVKAVPHDWLFPRTSVIVHHCGVGTMAAALRSGVPQVPAPFMLDQPHNAKLVVALNCAPEALPYAKLTSKKLASLINRITGSTDIRTSAARVGEQIRHESASSLDKYCDLVESVL